MRTAFQYRTDPPECVLTRPSPPIPIRQSCLFFARQPWLRVGSPTESRARWNNTCNKAQPKPSLRASSSQQHTQRKSRRFPPRMTRRAIGPGMMQPTATHPPAPPPPPPSLPFPAFPALPAPSRLRPRSSPRARSGSPRGPAPLCAGGGGPPLRSRFLRAGHPESSRARPPATAR